MFDDKLSPTLLKYVIKHAIRELLSGSTSDTIQYMVLEECSALTSTQPLDVLKRVFWKFESLVNNNIFHNWLWCPYIHLFYYLLEYESFRNKIHQIRCLKTVVYCPTLDHALGFIYGIIMNDENKMTDSIANIKKAKSNNNECPKIDSLTIRLPGKLLKQCSYEILLKIYKMLKISAGDNPRSEYTDAESIYKLQYLISNEECNICFDKTTNLYIPKYNNKLSNRELHKCAFVYCIPCKAEIGSICTVCKKPFI